VKAGRLRPTEHRDPEPAGECYVQVIAHRQEPRPPFDLH